MAVGRQAVQQGNDSTRNGFFSAVSLSQLAQDYNGQLNRLRHPV